MLRCALIASCACVNVGDYYIGFCILQGMGYGSIYFILWSKVGDRN